MQKKTIQKLIKTKVQDWIESIEDVGLRSDLNKNILVSGGSITSLFLGEPVNDYDIYIQDINVLKRVVEYYTKGITGVFIMDGRSKTELIDDILAKYKFVYDSLEEMQNAYAISLRNLKDNQIKMFFDSKDGGKRIEPTDSEKKYTPLFLSPNAISLSDDIQIVIRFHGNAEEIHKTFDFVHATNYFTFQDGLVTNIKALESLITKQLSYQGSHYPLTSIIRTKKFIKRGWGISAGELLKIMFQISDYNLHDPDVLEEQLIGVDVAYFGKLIEAIRNVDPEKLNSGYINVLIDKIFNESEDIEE